MPLCDIHIKVRNDLVRIVNSANMLSEHGGKKNQSTFHFYVVLNENIFQFYS